MNPALIGLICFLWAGLGALAGAYCKLANPQNDLSFLQMVIMGMMLCPIVIIAAVLIAFEKAQEDGKT
jgi:hypothetical protein